MKTTLRATLISAALCSFIPCLGSVLAADESAPAGPAHSFPAPDEVVKTLTSKLSLTPDQAGKIAPIIADRQAKLKAIMADASASRMERMHQSKAIMSDTDTQINAILTPDQQAKYAEIEQQIRQQARHRMQQPQ